MTRRLRIVLASAIVLVGLLVIVVLSFVGVTRTNFGQERVRQMVSSMLEGKVKGKVYIGRMSGGVFYGVNIDFVENPGDQQSRVFSSGPLCLSFYARDLFHRKSL